MDTLKNILIDISNLQPHYSPDNTDKMQQRGHLIRNTLVDEIKSRKRSNEDNNLTIYTNKLIEKFTYNLEKFNMNVLIAYLHETYNFLSKEIDKLNIKDLKENYSIAPQHSTFGSDLIS